jgi:hypothetical protein
MHAMEELRLGFLLPTAYLWSPVRSHMSGYLRLQTVLDEGQITAAACGYADKAVK